MTRPLTVIALAFILVGAMAMAGPTFGFATIAADRGVSVGTADDSSAYLGLEDRSASAAIDAPDGTTPVYTLTDNFGGAEPATVDASVVRITDESSAVVASDALEATVQPGSTADTFDVGLACGNGETLDGSYRVELRLLASAAGSSVDATRTTAAFVPVDCTTLSDEPIVVSVDENGDVATGGDVTVDNNVAVGGTISSGGSVTVGNNANVGSIVSQGDIIVANNLVSGDIVAGGNVIIGNNAEIDGDVSACGSVVVGNNAVVTGTILENQTDLPGVQC
ncbi:polymer-forming cytoskeletal protein [Natronorubrum sp. A-ect3]|uniref:polymer-forming cytoskeletal protein n=1 Tax=Natronorubrum sp. A-ect3 TaxID=3242698 RepID=UPI00359CEA42